MAAKEELDAIQRWIWATASLRSMRLSEAPAKVARPVILWEPAARSRDRHLGRYAYVNKVQQYGKLFVTSLDQLNQLEERLAYDLENKVGLLPVFDQEGAAGQEIAKLKNVTLTFGHSESLDVPITFEYEVAYARTRPPVPPAATYVGTRITKGELEEHGDN